MTAYTQFDYTKTFKLPVGDLEFGVWQIPAQAATGTPDWTALATHVAQTQATIAHIDVNHDDEESRYSWKVHCATAAGKAKYAYCQNPEPAAVVVMLI